MLLGFQTPFRLSGYDFRYVDHSIVLQSLRRIQLTSLLPSHCAGIVTKASGDGGIDGIIKEDQLVSVLSIFRQNNGLLAVPLENRRSARSPAR